MEGHKHWLEILTRSAFIISPFLVLALLDTGCVSQEETTPPRAATEQLLLSTAADRALAKIDLSAFAGQSVYIDFTYFDSYDAKYVEGEIRDAFSRAGALLAPDAKSANVIIEARSGAYSVDTNSAFFGFPSIPIPIPTTAETPVTPSLAFYQRSSELSYAKFALLAYSDKTHAHVFSSGSLDGNAYDTYRQILFISWWRSDIPEKNKNQKKAQKYQTWFPQYDLQNMPSPSSGTGASSGTNAPATPANKNR
jgi:hypothetical protein